MSENSDRNIQRLESPQKVLDLVTNEVSQSAEKLNPWKTNLVRFNELYMMVQKNKNYNGLSNIFVPELLRGVETIVAKLYNMIISNPNWFEYVGREETDDGPAVALTQLTRYQMDENGFKGRLMDSLRQMVVSGLTVRKVLWDFQEVKRTRPTRQENKVITETTNETTRDHWTFEPVDLLGFHISDVTVPYDNIQKAEWITEQYEVSPNWIASRTRKSWFSKVMKPELDAQINQSKEEQANVTQGKGSDAQEFKDQREQSAGYEKVSESGKVEILERWGLVMAEWVHTEEEREALGLEKDDMVEGVIYIANKTAILKLEANPFWHGQKPYASCPYVPKEFDFAGIGAVQIGATLQEELNDTRNQTMDNKTLILMTMWLKGRSAGIKNQDLRIRPQGVILTNDMKGLQALRPPVLTGVGVNIEGVIKSDLRESMGAAGNMQGLAQAGIDSATEAGIASREGLGRITMTAELYGELILKPVLILAEYLNYQFYDHTKVIKIIGALGVKFRELSPDQIVGYKDVVINVATDAAESPSVMRQQAMNYLSLVKDMPPEVLQYHWTLLDRIYKMLFKGRSLSEAYEPPPDKKELFTPEEEVDLVIAEHPVEAQEGQDHQAHLLFLGEEFDNMKYALTPKAFELFTKLIQSHQALLYQERLQDEANLLMQDAMPGEQGAAGDKRTPGSSSFTQPGKAPTDTSIKQQEGGPGVA